MRLLLRGPLLLLRWLLWTTWLGSLLPVLLIVLGIRIGLLPCTLVSWLSLLLSIRCWLSLLLRCVAGSWRLCSIGGGLCRGWLTILLLIRHLLRVLRICSSWLLVIHLHVLLILGHLLLILKN